MPDSAPTSDNPFNDNPFNDDGGDVREIDGRYRVIKSIGHGAFGKVWSAWDRRLERVVAVKVLRDVQLASRETRARFLREMRILARLDHPHIVPLFDADVTDDGPYLVMKLIKGTSLEVRAAAGKMDAEAALGVVRQAALGLDHAHHSDILHRDLKPSNVLVDENGHVYLVDFGLAAPLEGEAAGRPDITDAGLVVGTPRYMAPEILDGEPNTAHADLYALGAILYELLFREPCFRARDRRVLFAKIATAEPRFLEQPPGDVPKGVVDLLRSLLAKDPAARPDGARDLLRRLDDLLETKWAATQTAATIVTESGDAPLTIDDVDAFIESFVQRNQALLGQDEAGDADADPRRVDAVLTGLAETVHEAAPFVRRLRGSGRELDDGEVLPRALTLVQIAESIEKELQRRFPDVPGVDAVLLQFHLNVLAPLDALARQLERDREAETSWQGTGDEFFSFEDDAVTAASPAAAGWIEDLFSRKELKRYEAALTAVGDGRDEFVRELTSCSTARRTALLDAAWKYSDVILSRGRARSKVVFDMALSLESSEEVRGRWRTLYSLFRKVDTGGYWDAPLVADVLESYPEEERRILGRALLFHPWIDYRKLALRHLRPADFWWVITAEDVPLHWLLDIWKHLAPSADKSFLKIFFVTLRSRLVEVEDGEQLDVASVMAFLKEFFKVDVFHESTFFEMLEELQKTLRTRLKRHARLFDLDVEYARMYAEFLKRPRTEDLPMEGWGRVPLPIQRLLARRGYFQRHFCCHPIDPIALECLRHITARDSIDDFLALYAINGRLMRELAREERFFRDDRGKFLLVANPKTPAVTVARYLPFLRNDRLRHIVQSHECNQTARQLAERILNRRGAGG